MEISIPKRWVPYVEMVLRTSTFSLGQLFELGWEDILEDLSIGAGQFPPDMDPSLLEGELVELQIPYQLSDDQEHLIQQIQEEFGIDRDTILRACFLWGLFDQWPRLKSDPRYLTDQEWRKLVDQMPHDPCLSEEGG